MAENKLYLLFRCSYFIYEGPLMKKLGVRCRIMSCMSSSKQKKSLKRGWEKNEPSLTYVFQKAAEKSNFSQERAFKKDKDILGL